MWTKTIFCPVSAWLNNSCCVWSLNQASLSCSHVILWKQEKWEINCEWALNFILDLVDVNIHLELILGSKNTEAKTKESLTREALLVAPLLQGNSTWPVWRGMHNPTEEALFVEQNNPKKDRTTEKHANSVAQELLRQQGLPQMVVDLQVTCQRNT